jgi:hypothetical protein
MAAFDLWPVVTWVCLAGLSACSKDAPQPAAQAPAGCGGPTTTAPAAAPAETAPANTASADVAAQPPAVADTSTGAPSAGPRATEKHRLRITNYAKTPVSVSLNGEWVGQWDDHITVPTEQVLRGKNTAAIELTGEPANDLKVELQAERGGEWVPLLDLNFKGKMGSHTVAFVAK